MTETFPYGKRYWYPHMMKEDVAIWERFIEANPTAYDFVQYDVPCGSVPDFDIVVNEANNADASALYKKKIDVVGFKGNEIDIIELKPRAGAAAVGQIKLYKRLYIKDYTPPEVPGCVIITNEERTDVREYAEDEGVRILIA